VVSLKEASEPLEGGQHYPLFLLCLQHLHKTKGQLWLFEAFTESKINLISMLPENDRNKERLADILEDRALSFLYPMLRIESDLWKQITQVDCTPNSLYRWLKENVDLSLQNTMEFIQVLFTCLLKYITSEVSKKSLNENENQEQTQTNGNNITDYEKEILTKFQSVLKAFLHEKSSLQLMALYALQSYCFGLNFPKGMLLRWFLMLYDLEIIEEEVFIKWKEDINDEYPGKGKALFQVNQWLTWLEEAEEEEEDDEHETIRN
jgi:translation initiation factor 4G